MPKLFNPHILDLRQLVVEPIKQNLLSYYRLTDELGVDIYTNKFHYELGIMSLLRSTRIEPTFETTAGLHGVDAHAPGNGLSHIEIKGSKYDIKTFKLPDISTMSMTFKIDRISQQATLDKINEADGYALGVFLRYPYNVPSWVKDGFFEPIVLMWIKGSGVKKVSAFLLNKIEEIKEKQKQILITNPNQRNVDRAFIKYSDIYHVLGARDLRLVVNGKMMNKKTYEQCLKEGESFWLKTKSIPNNDQH